MKHCGKF